MSDEAAFLTAIRAQPSDDTARLVYADWLQEHGQDDRAEFIRVQCEIARFGTSSRQQLRKEALKALRRQKEALHASVGRRGRVIVDDAIWKLANAMANKLFDEGESRRRVLTRRELDLLDAHRKEWFPLLGRSPGFAEDEPLRWWPIQDALPSGARSLHYRIDGTPRRGFLDSLTLDTRDWFRYAALIRATHPVTRVKLSVRPIFGVGGATWKPGGVWLAPERGGPAWYVRMADGTKDDLGVEDLPLVLNAAWPGVMFDVPPA